MDKNTIVNSSNTKVSETPDLPSVEEIQLPVTQSKETLTKNEECPIIVASFSAEDFIRYFDECSKDERVDLFKKMLDKMDRYELKEVNDYLEPKLQRDFIYLFIDHGLEHISEKILSYLDHKSLAAAELVSRVWHNEINSQGMLWKKLLEYNVRTDAMWRCHALKKRWIQYLFKPGPSYTHRHASFFRQLHPRVAKDIKLVEKNWFYGNFDFKRINCNSANARGVYSIQFDDKKIVSGLRDNSIKIYNMVSHRCDHVLIGHTGSVLCLQYDDDVIISGSSDKTIRVWDIKTVQTVNVLIYHNEAVLHLKFHNGMLASCSKDRLIVIWDITSPTQIELRRVLVGHRAAVNAVDFDENYIVSASGDRTIKVWEASTGDFVRTLYGHKRGVACLQYRDGLIISGGSDNTIRLWDIDSGACMRVIEGHETLVRCVKFDSKYIVSGAYNGKIKVWSLMAALNPKKQNSELCLYTLAQHTGRVFRVQFDEMQIVSSSHDDSIIIWDFLRSRNTTNAETST